MVSLRSTFWLMLPIAALGQIDRQVRARKTSLPTAGRSNTNRHRIVSDNNIVRTKLINNETTPLQVGNGNFAFGVDTTGMQTYLPFNTMSVWAWHNDTEPSGGCVCPFQNMIMTKEAERATSPGIRYQTTPACRWRPTAAMSLMIYRTPSSPTSRSGSSATLTESTSAGSASATGTPRCRRPASQTRARSSTSGAASSPPRSPSTAARSKSSRRATLTRTPSSFDIDSELIQSGDLTVELDFPYPPIHSTKYKYEVFVGVYDFPANHTTRLTRSCEANTAHIYHEMQATRYNVNLRWPDMSPLSLQKVEPEGSTALTAHRYTLAPASGRGEQKPSSLSFTAHFSPRKRLPDLPETIRARNTDGWHDYWDQGGFVDLTASTNPNATELQRRIITSQYHVRVNSAAKGESPQESGLMFFWVLLPTSFARAKLMGWEGARWPKMTDTMTGRSSQASSTLFCYGSKYVTIVYSSEENHLTNAQPHPMYMAMLAYKTKPTQETLERWDPILEATADYMASYAWYNESSGNYDLGPPLARPVPGHWTTVASKLSKPPQVDGLYAVYEGVNSTWWQDPKLNGDPRSLIMMQGILPNTPAVDEEVGRRTADKVWEVWTDQKIRGWGRPILAINSARVGNPERAIYHLTAYDYWKFDDAGFAIRGGDGGTPPPFVPGNAGFSLGRSVTICFQFGVDAVS
ncbi:conserved hypothetical protein [Verticillium alfalfae VaMs.102]|uniref:Uncharacterized protein n=1 Tax=Verticillium alfalfae (strain VaMs.102 / ATCC MYA-4576 / FGSC 10136) TaxID=526221 RepID=C9SYG1_VERA1|nr:conserved hypothetical protein [Verticillium alfalfae VaMs.102]EEY23826.1 conserved hypothetical protein [Verticillium alfalfae VaMs.102]